MADFDAIYEEEEPQDPSNEAITAEQYAVAAVVPESIIIRGGGNMTV